MALTYRQVKDLHDALKDSGAVTEDLPAWSQEMNRLTKSDLYGEGLNDNWVKRASVGLDRLLEATGVPDILGSAGGAIGSLVGNEEAGQAIGHGALRSLVDFAPLLAGGGLGAVAKLGGTGLLSGAHTYTETGSPAAGVVSGLTAAAMPAVAGAGEQGVLRALGVSPIEGKITTELGEQAISRYLPQNVGQGIGAFAGGQLAAGGLMEGSSALQAGLDPNSEYHLDPSKLALDLTLGQLPFAGVHALSGAKGEGWGGAKTREHEANLQRNIADTTARLDAARAAEEAAKKQSMEDIPVLGDPMTPTAKAQAEARARELLGTAADLKAEATPDSEELHKKAAQDYEDLFFEHGDVLKDKPLELPITNPEEKPVFSDANVALQEAENDVDTAKTLVEFHQAVGKLNHVRTSQGMPPLTPERIATIAENRGLSQKDAVKAETNKTRRIKESIEEASTQPKTFRRTFASDEERVAAEEADTKAKALAREGILPQPLPKLDNDTEALHNILGETITKAQVQRDSEDSFRQWQKTNPGSPDKTSLPIEAERFKIYWRLRETGDIGREENLSKSDLETLNSELAKEGLSPTLPDFPERDHVLNWDDAVNERFRKQLDEQSPAPQAERKPNLPAGGGFVWGLEDYDPATNRLGRHTLPKTGVLAVSQFKNMGGRGKALADAEIELGKQVVPEAFDEKGNVDVRKLYEGLKTKGPVVEIHKQGEGAGLTGDPEAIEANRQFHSIVHDLDTLGIQNNGLSIQPNGNKFTKQGQTFWMQNDGSILNPNKVPLTPAELAKLNEFHPTWVKYSDLNDSVNQPPSARYSFLGPKSEQDMPGYVEGLVRVPQEKYDPEGHTYPLPPKYTGPHFGGEDHDVLAFFRGYEDQLPDGRKAFHVIEVQSDWGQDVRKQREQGKPTAQEIARGDTQVIPPKNDHPLLSVYEPLALKAAIQHAKSVGADVIMLSDGETAMMTEGHDKQETAMTPEGNREEPSQSVGMRLHYDQTLPSAMKKLTGQEGEKVEMGVHKQGGDLMMNQDGTTGPSRQGSPVFRNPDGTPKSSITGRTYPLDKIATTSDTQGGLTLTDPSRAPSVPHYEPKSPEEATKIAELGLARGAQGLLDHVRATATNPLHQQLAELLSQYPEQLKRSQTVIVPENVGSSAYMDKIRRNGNIGLSASLLSAPDSVRNSVALHELVHQVSQGEIDNPTKAETVKNLDSLRDRMREVLPQNLKDTLQKALDSDFIGRWKNGKAEFGELGTKRDESNLLYALLNTKEFVAQGLENSATRRFMQSQKGQKLGLWAKFKNYVKSLLGVGEKVDDTAFGEFLSHTGALLESGEHVASFYNFGEHYLENQGLSRGQAAVQSNRAMALLHEAAQFDMSHEDMLRSVADSAFNRGPQFQRATNNLERSIQNADEDYQSWVQLAPELGHEPTKAGLDEFTQEALRGDATALQALDVMPEAQARYVFEKLHNMREVFDTIRAASVKKNEGVLNLADPKALRGPVADAIKSIDRVLDSEKMLDQAVTTLQGLNGVTPAGYWEKMAAAAPSLANGAPAPKSLEPFVGKDKTEQKGFFQALSRFFKPIAQYTDPFFKEGAAKLYQMSANAKRMSDKSFEPLTVDFNSNTITPEHNKRLQDFLSNTKLAKAHNKWIYENQLAGQDKVTKLPMTDSRVAQHLKGLTEAEKFEVNDMVDRQGFSNMFMQKQKLEKMQQIMVTDGAKLLNRTTDLKHTQSLQLAQKVWDVLSVDKNDPLAVAKAQTDLQAIQSRLSPEAMDSLWNFTKNQKAQFDEQKAFFDANPNWATAQRQGPYRVKFFNRQGKVEVHGALNRKDAEQQATEQGGKIVEFTKVSQPGEEDMPYFGSDTQAIHDRLSQLLDQELDIRRSAGESADELAFARKISSVNQFARETAARGYELPGSPVRGLTRGAENVPYLSNHLSYLTQEANYWTRRLARSQIEALIAQKEMPPEVKADLKTHLENVMQADPDSIRKLNNFTRTWFMGFNPANVIINATQPFVTHVAELTSMTGKPLDSYRRVLSSLRELGGRFLPKFLGASKEWSNPELARLEKDAQAAGEIGLSQFDNDAAVREATAVNFKRAADGNRPKSFGQYMSSLGGMFSKAGMWMFQHGEQLNNRLAINTAFKLFREQGKSYEEARDAAFEFNHRVNFAGGKAGRPIGAFEGRSPVLRGAAMLGTSMQSYVLGTTFQIIRYLKNGGFRPQGLTPHEVFSARKAGVQMLATQLAAAGVLGLPFVSGAISLLDKAFPEAEVNRHLREGVQSFFREDQENGGPLTDISMTGLPSMLGWDLQSRLSMGNTLPGVSEVNGFQPENLLGPPVNLVSSFVRGGAKLVQGQTGGASAFVPSALKKMLSLVSDGGDLRDYRDRPIATDVTPGEKLGMVLGFNPKRLSDFNAASRMADLADTNEKRATGEFNQQMAEEVMKGNFGTVRQTLLQKAQSDKSYDPADAVRSIARVAEELSFPRDLRREGTSSSRSKLLSTFNLNPNLPPETLRLAFRQQIEQRFGLSPSSPRDQLLAQTIDDFRAKNPTASRMELRRQAEVLLRKARPAGILAE